MAIEVLNLATGATATYTCDPVQAVIAAYAQERGDWSTWQYQERYGALVRIGKHSVGCGDWAALNGGYAECSTCGFNHQRIIPIDQLDSEGRCYECQLLDAKGPLVIIWRKNGLD